MSASITSKVKQGIYRTGTVLKAFKQLYSLPPEKVDAFLNSYEIYDHDWSDEKALVARWGKDYYAQVKQRLVDCYSVWNYLCSIGQVEKMYIPPAIDLSASLIENQNLVERRMAKDLGLKPGMKALDIGCGRGRVANHIASLTGAHVTGINIDQTQLDSAKKFAEESGLSNQLHFQYGDLNDIPYPFPDASLDGIYHVQVFSLAKDLLKLFKELHRMLKPGGMFVCMDWVSLENYNPKDPHHADLMRRIKPLIGAIGTPSVKTYVSFLEQAGFEVQVSENASPNGVQAPLIDKADKFFTTVTKLIKGLVKVKLLPNHFNLLFERLTRNGQAMVEADRLRICSMVHYIVAKKK